MLLSNFISINRLADLGSEFGSDMIIQKCIWVFFHAIYTGVIVNNLGGEP